MIKELGHSLLIKKKLWKVFYRLYPYVLIPGVIFIFFIPYTSDLNHIEENALNPQLLSESQSKTMSDVTETLLYEMKNLEQEELIQFIINDMNKLELETYIQDFSLIDQLGSQIEGKNLIGKMKTKRSNGFECNIFTFEYNDKNKLRNIAFILSLIRVLQTEQINYLSRDLLFVGYPTNSTKYARGIRAFLDEYFNPTDLSRIPRCGVIRQAINVVLEDNFQQVALKFLGLNGRVPDHDFFININHLMSLSGLQYYYRDTAQYQWVSNFQDLLNEKIILIWKQFDLDKYYKLPLKPFQFNSFFKILIDSMEGNIHDAHSYLFKYGIHAVTIKGFNQGIDDNKKNKNVIANTNAIARVVEGANRAYMALDEHLHAGSTLYIPINSKKSVTVQQYVWPPALIGLCLAIQAAACFIKSAVLDNNVENKKHAAIGYTNGILIDLISILSLTTPFIAEQMMQITHNKIVKFDSFQENQDEISELFWLYVQLNIALYGIFYLIIIPLIRKYLFGSFRIPRSDAYVNCYLVSVTIHPCKLFEFLNKTGLGMIYCCIQHIPYSYFVAILICPWFLVIQPLIPYQKFNLKSFACYLLNIVFLIGYYYLSTLVSMEDVLEFWKSNLIDYKSVGTYSFYFIHLIALPTLLRIFDFLII